MGGQGAESKKTGRRHTPPKGRELQKVIARLREGDPDEILTTSQCADLTGFSQQSFFNWINRKHNKLKATKPGREWQVKRGDVTEFLERRNFREAGDSAVSTALEEAGGDAVTRLLLLRPAQLQGESGADVHTRKPFEVVDTKAAAYQAFEYLIIVAEMALNWRRAYMTMLAAGDDDEWAKHCELVLVRAQQSLLSVSAGVSNRLLVALYELLYEAVKPDGVEIADLREATSSLFELTKERRAVMNVGIHHAFLSNPDYATLRELFDAMFSRVEPKN